MWSPFQRGLTARNDVNSERHCEERSNLYTYLTIPEFLHEKSNNCGIKFPKDIDLNELVEIFCLYVEDYYYEWLKAHAKSFFTVGSDGIDWDIVRDRMKKYQVK